MPTSHGVNSRFADQQSSIQTILVPVGAPQTDTNQLVSLGTDSNNSTSVPLKLPIGMQQIGAQYSNAGSSVNRAFDSTKSTLQGSMVGKSNDKPLVQNLGIHQLTGNQFVGQRAPRAIHMTSCIRTSQGIPSGVGTNAQRMPLTRTADGKSLLIVPTTFAATNNQAVVSNSLTSQPTNITLGTETSTANAAQATNTAPKIVNTAIPFTASWSKLVRPQMVANQPTAQGFTSQRVLSPSGVQVPPTIIRTADGKNLLLTRTTSAAMNSSNVSNSSRLQPTNVAIAATSRTSETLKRTGAVQTVINASTTGVLFDGFPSDNMTPVLESLLKECSAVGTSGVNRRSSVNTKPGPSSLYANPLLPSQVRSSRTETQSTDTKVPEEESDLVNDSYLQPKPDNGFELKFEDGGYTMLIPQTGSQKDENESESSNKDRSNIDPAEKDLGPDCPQSHSDNEFDLQIDLDRLEHISKELDQLNNLGRNLEQSKELELIQQEQMEEKKEFSEECESSKEFEINSVDQTKKPSTDLESIDLQDVRNIEMEQEQNRSKELELVQLGQKKERNRELEIITFEQEKEQNKSSQIVVPDKVKETNRELEIVIQAKQRIQRSCPTFDHGTDE